MFARSATALVLALATGATLAGCGQAGSDAAGSTGGSLSVVASFYPLQWATSEVAGGHAEVTSLTRPGAEPHDLELTPRDVADVADADVVVYLHGFQPAVDDAVSQEGDDSSLDVAHAAQLDLVYTPIEEGEEHADEADSTDPHFWLDPTRLASVVDAIGSRLADVDPANAGSYQANADRLVARLEDLDRDFRAGLADCASTDLVTSHNAFGYLARRYGFTQLGITGLTPEAEPRPADLAAVATFVRTHAVRTIYSETLASPRLADTVATETGATTSVLDPIEGITRDSAGQDYLSVMRANLTSLREGQACR